MRSVFMLGVMFYVPLCNFTLQYFDCTSQPDGTWTLDAEASTFCYEGTHASYIYHALYGVVVYMIGIPTFVLLKLKQHKAKACIEMTVSELCFSCTKTARSTRDTVSCSLGLSLKCTTGRESF